MGKGADISAPVVITDRLSENWPRQVTCASCRSELEISLENLQFGSWKVSGYHFDGSAVNEDKYTFACPVCGTEANGNEIPEAEIPLAERQRLRDDD